MIFLILIRYLNENYQFYFFISVKENVQICYMLVDIYEKLEIWDEAYWTLCIKMEYYLWIYSFRIKRIAQKSKIGTKIKEIIQKDCKLNCYQIVERN